jgi:hypothetical protein
MDAEFHFGDAAVVKREGGGRCLSEVCFVCFGEFSKAAPIINIITSYQIDTGTSTSIKYRYQHFV